MSRVSVWNIAQGPYLLLGNKSTDRDEETRSMAANECPLAP